MVKWRCIQVISAIIFVASFLILIWFIDSMRLKFILFSLVFSVFIWRWSQWVVEKKASIQKKKEEEKLVSILNHNRHDWLNDLQLIFGYVKLKKYEKLEQYMDKIKDKLEQESKIAKLDDPSLTLDLMSFRHNNRTFNLNLKVESDLKLSKPNIRKIVSKTIMETIHVFQKAAEISSDSTNDLDVHMSMDDASMILEFKYNGKYFSEIFENEVKNKLRKLKLKKEVEWVSDVKEMKAYVKIKLSVQT